MLPISHEEQGGAGRCEEETKLQEFVIFSGREDSSSTRPSQPLPPSLPLDVAHLTLPAVVGPVPGSPPGVRLHHVGHGQPGQLLEGSALTGGGAAAYHGPHQESEGVHLVLGRDPALPRTHGVVTGAVATPASSSSSSSGVASVSSTSAA